jgi:hypothetical protein
VIPDRVPSQSNQFACEFVRDGGIGKIQAVECVNFKGPTPYPAGGLTGQPIPKVVDWDLWQGQAPVHPFNQELFQHWSANNGRWWGNWREYSNSQVTGLGLNAIGGFFVNFPASQSNPIFTPQAPNGFGQGNVYGRLGLLQVAPTVARKLTDRLSVGVAPTVTIADLQVNPGAFGTPDDANGDGFASYPSAQNGRLRCGLGFQIGLYLTTEGCWNFGLSFKSPQWFERFELFTRPTGFRLGRAR